MELKNKKILVLGKGKTGSSTAAFLEQRQAIVRIADERDDGPFIKINPGDYDLIVQSPGISRQHPFLVRCDEEGVAVTNEIELAYLHTDKPIIGVTGTNGKTTIVNLLQHIMESCGRRSALVGNVGKPFIDQVLEPVDCFVLELSSYQLETVERFRPKVAIISNLTPDHLERHKTMEHYLAIKAGIYRNMDATDTVILNYDDEWLRSLAPAKANVLYFSRRQKVPGIYEEDGRIILSVGGETEKVLMEASELKILGGHNVENAMAALLASLLLGLEEACVLEGARSFAGVEHRLEFIREKDGVAYYNDSKSTNPEAAIIAVKAFGDRRVQLILGGSEKQVSYLELAECIAGHNVLPVLQGETAAEIREALEQAGCRKHLMAKDLKEALDLAVEAAEPGSVVLLSPACASFDQFENFEHRGVVFKEYVREI